MIKLLFSTFFLLLATALSSQNHISAFSFDLGLTTIPLRIERTDVYRWMLFPSGSFGISLNNKLTLSGSYLFADLWLGNYPGTDTFIYSEMPRLGSYEEAVQYEGSKFGNSRFSNYIFIGFDYTNFTSNALKIEVGSQIGYRFGYTYQLANVIPYPSSQAGFKSHPTSYESRGPGLNIFIKPKLFFAKSIYLSSKIGIYIFYRWPKFQPYTNLSLGISI